MVLTEEGESHWEEATRVVYSYIDLMKKAPSDALMSYWNEDATMSSIGFDFTEPSQPLPTATSLSRRLLLYGPSHALAAGALLGEYTVKCH